MNFGSGFGTSGTSSFAPQSSGAFGIFGAASTPGGFGVGASQGSVFGANPSSSPGPGGVFSQSSGSQMFGGGAFGQQQQQNRPFGSSTPTSFGAGGNTFGMQSTPSGMAMGGQPQGTFGRPFERVAESSEHNSRDSSRAFLMSICAMAEFRANEPERLRAVDYKNGHKRHSGQTPSPSGTGTSLFGGTGGAFGSGVGATGSGTPGGFGSGFRAGSTFGGGSTGVFGQTTPQSSGAFGMFGASGSAFGQAASGSAFGTGFNASSGSSLFGGGGTGAFGQQQKSSGALFGSQQSSGSIFGNQAGGGFGGTFGRPQSSGTNIFGQSSGTSIFGSGTSAFGNSGGGLFQSSGGFSFGGGQSSGNIFCGQTSTTSIFGQASSQPGIFGQQPAPFGQPSSLFGPASQGPMQAGSIFGPPQAPSNNTPALINQWPNNQQQQQQPQSKPGGYFANPPWEQDPSSGNPNWTPEYGLVVPKLSLHSNGADHRINRDDTKGLSAVNSTDYLRRIREDHYMHRLGPMPVPFSTLPHVDPKNGTKKPELGWDGFRLPTPAKKSLEDEIKQSIELHKKQTTIATAPASSVENPPSAHPTFWTQPNDSSVDNCVEALRCAEKERRARTEGLSNLDTAEIRSLLPISTKLDYYLMPTLEELEKLVAMRGRDALKSVPGVEIGRNDYGKICFSVAVNLERVNIDNAVTIKRGRVATGKGENPLANIPATVTLLKVFSKLKGKDGLVNSGAELEEEIDRFKRYTEYMGGIFVSYDRHGTWIFKVANLHKW